MKFLVFNIVVLLSLGYLITGQKNQSVGNWLDALPEKILNSYETKDLTNFLPEKQVELAQTPAKNVSKVESLVSKNVEDTEASQSKISAEKLELLIEETVKLPIGFIVGSSFITGSIIGNFFNFGSDNKNKD